MRRKMTAAERSAKSEAMRQAWADGKFARKPKSIRPDVWTVAHDRRLRQLAGQYPLEEIAARLSGEFPGTPRTATAVMIRLKRIGESRQLVHFTARQLAGLFGVDAKTVTHSWIARGWLAAAQQVPGLPGSTWVVTAAQLEAFVRDYRHVYDWQKMRRGQWRNLAELEWRRDPLLTLPDASRVSGVSVPTLRNHLARGWLQGYRQLRKSGAQAGTWLVARSALRTFEYHRPELVQVSGHRYGRCEVCGARYLRSGSPDRRCWPCREVA